MAMRRIAIWLITAAGLLALVSTTTFVVSEHPTALGQKQPTRTVSIQNFSFKPANITIKRGTRVIWINKDGTQHTATANDARSFDSGTLGRNGVFRTGPFSYAKPSSVADYLCNPSLLPRGGSSSSSPFSSGCKLSDMA